MRWAVRPRARGPRTSDPTRERADAPPGDRPERGVVTVEEEHDDQHERDQEQQAERIPGGEDAQSQSEKDQGHDPGEPMVLVNRLAQ